MLGMQSPSSPTLIDAFEPPRRKRKAESHDNDRERLSKRLSRLNIDHKGSKLCARAETPSAAAASSRTGSKAAAAAPPSHSCDETMQVDDTKDKVYIYDLDAELSSDSDTDDGKILFLPDIAKQLRENRIPRHILANDEGELAGMQLVLYSDPKSISVPEEQDGVRRAIIEARQRARDRQRKPETRSTGTVPELEAIGGATPPVNPFRAQFFPVDDPCDAMEVD